MEVMEGELLNTAFGIYAPDGETKLTPTARSPRMLFGRRSAAAGLRNIADDYPGVHDDEPAHTPDFTSTRESINIAACDSRPLVIAYGPDVETCAAYEAQLRALAWSPEFVGRVHWDFTHETDDDFRALVPDAPEGAAGILIVQPEPFGRSAHVIGTLNADAPLTEQREALQEAIAQFEATFTKLSYEEHVAEGHDLGVRWEEAIRMGDRPMDSDRRRRGRDNRRPNR